MIYAIENCPKTWIQPLKINCCICGEFTGMVNTYPSAWLHNLGPNAYMCRLGYGCKKKCICECSLCEIEASVQTFGQDGKTEYRCINCKNIIKIDHIGINH